MARQKAKTKTALTAADLKAAPYNPREMGPEARAGLEASMGMFGDLSGITWNRRTGCLVTGHQRVESLKAKGAEFTGEAFELDGERFGVRVVDWDEATEQAACLAANNPLIAGAFTDGLGEIIEELEGFEGLGDLRLDGLLPSEGGAGPEAEPPGENGFGYQEQFGVIVVCEDEAGQAAAYEDLHAQGYEVKVVSV